MKWKVRGWVVHKNPGAASLSLWRAEEALRSDFSMWEGNGTLGWNLKLAGQWELTLNAPAHQFGREPIFLGVILHLWLLLSYITTGGRVEEQSRKPRVLRSQEQPTEVMEHKWNQRSRTVTQEAPPVIPWIWKALKSLTEHQTPAHPPWSSVVSTSELDLLLGSISKVTGRTGRNN